MATPYVKGRHDCGIVNTDGTITGLMLVRKNGIPQYSVFYDQYLANQFFTGESGYASLPAEKELAIRQDDYRAGFGLNVYDANDTKRYLASYNMDLRHKGMAIASPKATTVTFPAGTSDTATIINGNMELTTGWLDAGARSAVQAHGGTYSWLITSGVDAYQDATTWSNNWQGAYVTLTGWIWADSVNDGRIGLNDGVDTSWSGYHAGTSAWVSFTVNKQLGAAATRLRLFLGDEAVGNVYFDDVTVSITALSGQPLTGVDFNNAQYLAAGNILSKLNAGGTAYVIVAGMPAKITDLEVFGSNLFIALGTSTDCEYMSTAEAFTVSTAAVKRFKYFKQVTAATPTLWGVDGDNTMRSNTNPVNGGAAWSGQTTVASSADVITGLFTDAGSIYITKEDMPYYLDSTGAVKNDLAPELATLVQSTDNGKSANFWLHNFYIPWGQSLLEYDGGVNTWRNPNDFSTNLPDFAGQVFAVAGDDRYLYAIVDNNTKVEVLAGRLEVIDSTTKWVWHSIAEITLTGCETCWISSIFQKRLWISSTTSSESLYYIPLPLAYGNILADTNRDFVSGGSFETPWLHANFKDTKKAYPELTISMAHNYDADIYFATHYKTLSNSTYTKIADMKGSTTSMVATNALPDAGANHPVDTAIRLKFVVNTDVSNTTPVLSSYNLKGYLDAPQRRIISLQVRCAQELLLNDGTKDLSSFNVVKATMDELVKATWAVQFTDIAGTVTNVRPLPINAPWWQTTAYEKGREQERIYNLLLQEV